MVADPRTLAVDRVLRDGGSIHIRAIRPDDKERLVEHFSRLGAQSVYFRFFGVKKRLTPGELRQFTELDFRQRVGLVATLVEDGQERIIGVGRYAITVTGNGAPCRAEVAFAVADRHQRRGIGAVLLEHLAEIARAQGVEEFEADVLGENNAMLAVFMRSGFRVTRSLAGGVFHLRFPTEETPESTAAQLERDRRAAAASMRGCLAPRAVAVIGASAQPGKLGGVLVQALLDGDFRGPVYPVHPSAAPVAGLPGFARVADIGAPVDLALVAVPADGVGEVLTDCARAGVRGVVVVSAGFAESGAAGGARQRALATAARAAGMRLIGPNSIGVMNTDPAVRLNASVVARLPAPGPVGVLTQSDAVGLALLARCARLDLGLSTFVSVGNKADVSGNDLLAYWSEDERTQVVLLYLESFGNPRRFARLAPALARRKPIVAVKAGRTAPSPAAPAADEAPFGPPDVAVDALFEQAGVIRTDTLEDLFDVASLLAAHPMPPGARVAVVTNSGGFATVLADAGAAGGLTLATPAAGANPLDLLATARPEEYEAALARLGGDAAVDALVAIFASPRAREAEAFAAAIARGAGLVPAEKPVLVVFLCGDGIPAALHDGPRGRLPAYEFPESAARALAAAARYAAWRARPAGTVVELADGSGEAVRAVVDRVLAGAAAPVTLARADVAAILRAAGIALAMAVEVPPAEAAATAERVGYPLVMKAVAPGLVQRRAAGGVLFGLRDVDAVRRAVRTLRRRIPGLSGVVLQREIQPMLEALVGVRREPTFGPLVVCGLGGHAGALARDFAWRLPPVSDRDAEAMVARLRLAPLLDGYRDAPPADRAGLLDVLTRVSALVDVIPEIESFTIDPLALLAPGQGAVVLAASMRLAPG